MELEKTFASAFGNSARYFAGWGIASFAFWLALLAFYAWELSELIQYGAISATIARLHQFLLLPIALGAGLTFLVSAIEFLRRVYRVRKFLMQRGRLEFASWLETVITFGVPIANFFVPWNRLDVIRETLRGYVETKNLNVVSDPKKKLRTLGILWGINSLVSVRGHVEDPTWMSMVLAVESVLLALSLWTFVLATKWLSELMSDFEVATVPA